jgi:peptidoglycan/xylan/chitin deacetylase (PgdA/CDA1 family)
MHRAIVRTGLEALYFSGAHRWLRPFVGGLGVILTLHHVRPSRQTAFQPNRLLEVTPGFLDGTIKAIRDAGLDFVSIDDVHRRLATGSSGRRFACLTLDDGYRDNLEFAYPILKRHAVPFTVYVPTSFPDRAGELWWLALEAIIARQNRIELAMNGEVRRLDCGSPAEKQQIFDAVYWWLRSLSTEDAMRSVVRDLASRYAVDIHGICDELCMTWDEIARLAADPLVSIGAHTVSHSRLGKISEEAARDEMRSGAAAIEAALGVRPRHFSYPVGDPTSAGPREFALARELGFLTGVTTRPGMLFPEHQDHMTALPRISLNGEFQERRYVEVLMSGAATAVFNGFRQVDAA